MLWNATGECTGGASHCVCAATTTTRQSAVAAQRHQATQPSGCSRVLACGKADSGHDQPLHHARADVLLQLAVLAGAARPAESPAPREGRPAVGIRKAMRRPGIWWRSGQGWPSEAAPAPMLCSRAMRVFGSSAGPFAGASWIGCGAGEWGWVMVRAEAATDKGGGRCVARNPVRD